MNKDKIKTIKRVISIILVVSIVGLLAAMPLLSKQNKDDEGPVASILSGTVVRDSINSEVIGGGTLEEESAVSINVPSEVKLTEFLVSNGDTVNEGDEIARVDRVTVMLAIASVQETLDEISSEIEEERDLDSSSEITALAGGKVKIIYAQEGDNVQNVMLEHGALAVLSLDGLMALKFDTTSNLSVGSSLNVTLSDGSIVTGEVNSNLSGEMVVVFADNGYEVGEVVTVTTEDGTEIGFGETYIYSPWNAIAYSGTVDSVNITEGESVDAGEVIMELSDAGYSATYQQLMNQREKYENLLMDLFKMYQTETLYAPCSGVISGVDLDSIQLLSAGEETSEFTLLSNSPNGDDSITYVNKLCKVTATGVNGWALSMNPQNIAIEDYMNTSSIEINAQAMTEITVYNPNDPSAASTPIYELSNNTWVMVNPNQISVGDVLLFASDNSGNYVWIVRVQKASANESPNPTNPTNPSFGGGDSLPGNDDSGNSGSGTNPSGFPSDGSGNSGNSSIPNFSGSASISDMTGNFTYDGSMVIDQTEDDSRYSLDTALIASVTPQDTVSLTIKVNELDINSLSIGMEASVKVNALNGEKFTATIVDISNRGSNNGGYSYFNVKLSFERNEDMLVGMNATATIVISTAEDVMTVPAEALVENGTETVIYLGYDTKKEELINPITVTVGVSDGQNVQITSGLSEGTTYYYAYYDTLLISNTPASTGGFPF